MHSHRAACGGCSLDCLLFSVLLNLFHSVRVVCCELRPLKRCRCNSLGSRSSTVCTGTRPCCPATIRRCLKVLPIPAERLGAPTASSAKAAARALDGSGGPAQWLRPSHLARQQHPEANGSAHRAGKRRQSRPRFNPLLLHKNKKALDVSAKCFDFLPILVGAIGLEPTTPTMSRWCSNQLSYAPAKPSTIARQKMLQRRLA